MTRIAYISRINLLSGRTNVYNSAKTCEALNSQADFSAKLITTDQKRDIKTFSEKMAITKPFEIVCLEVTDTRSKFTGKKWFEAINFLAANIRAFIYIIQERKNIDVIYYRDESLFLAAFFVKVFSGKKIFFEIHSVYERAFRQMKNVLAVYFADGVVAISSGLKRYYEKTNNNILISLCSSYEDSWFDYSKSKTDFRKLLKLPEDKFIIGYTGVVGLNPNNDYYEIDDAVRALVDLPRDIIFVIVGELNNNAAWLRELSVKLGVSDRITIIPWQERSMIPKYLQAFDVNVIPKRKKDLVGDSPAKMFPALAAGVPIIAGRAECIEEVLTDGIDALFVSENSPSGWAKAISKVYDDHAFREKVVAGASNTKGKYTWDKRGNVIAAFITHDKQR